MMTLLGLVIMMMTSGVAGKTYLVETADGDLPALQHGGAIDPLGSIDHPLEQGIITILILTFLNFFTCQEDMCYNSHKG